MGGPQVDDSFEDSRGWCCAAYNEVAIDYNAGFTGAVARLVLYYQDQKLFSDCGLDLGWDHPNATLVSFAPASSTFAASCMTSIVSCSVPGSLEGESACLHGQSICSRLLEECV